MLEHIVVAEVPFSPDNWRAPRLANSSRRHEDATQFALGKQLNAFIAYPDTDVKVPVVLMVPADQGVNNWAKTIADEIPAMGYIILIVDLLSGHGPQGVGCASITDLRDVFRLHSRLVKDDAGDSAQLNAWGDYAIKLQQARGKMGAIGFAWGGGRIARFVWQRAGLSRSSTPARNICSFG